MEIEETTKDGVRVITVRGRVQMAEADQFEEHIRKIEKESSNFIVDLSQASYICSMALGALIASRRRIMRTGGEMRIVAPSGDILDVLRLTMIDKVIMVEATLESALASFLNRLQGLRDKDESS